MRWTFQRQSWWMNEIVRWKERRKNTQTSSYSLSSALNSQPRESEGSISSHGGERRSEQENRRESSYGSDAAYSSYLSSTAINGRETLYPIEIIPLHKSTPIMTCSPHYQQELFSLVYTPMPMESDTFSAFGELDLSYGIDDDFKPSANWTIPIRLTLNSRRIIANALWGAKKIWSWRYEKKMVDASRCRRAKSNNKTFSKTYHDVQWKYCWLTL